MKNLSKFVSILATILVLALPFVSLPTAWATTIEGFTPEGNFQTVGVSDAGALFVDILSTTPQHVITDIGSQVYVSSVGGTVAVTGVLGTTASTSTLSISAQVAVPGGDTIVYPADTTRKQGSLCNTSPAATLFIGPTGVTTTTGIPLPAGSCLSPDVPSSFIGALHAASTGAATAAYIYYK
jgi:hypothetical protein